MMDWKQRKILVLGARSRGLATARYLLDSGAEVYLSDPGIQPEEVSGLPQLKEVAKAQWLPWGKPIETSVEIMIQDPSVQGDPGCSRMVPEEEVAAMGELEFGYRESQCLNIAIAGSNGKSSAAACLKAIMESGQRETMVAGPEDAPIAGVITQTRQLDFLTLKLSPEQLQQTTFFRPSIALLLNLAPHPDMVGDSLDDVCRQMARLFANQQAHDWLIIQSEALARLQSLGIHIPGKVISFSSQNRRADVFMDRGLLISRINGWSGPLFNMAECPLQGEHHAENVMAAMLVGHILKISVESMKLALKQLHPLPSRGERLRELDGVTYINDASASNPLALDCSLTALKPPKPNEPHVWLIAGGDISSLDYHQLGPLISHRVKGVFLIGPAGKHLRAAWSLFAPCQISEDLLQACEAVSRKALPHDVVLLSPACSTLESFQSVDRLGELFRKVVSQLSSSRAPDDALHAHRQGAVFHSKEEDRI